MSNKQRKKKIGGKPDPGMPAETQAAEAVTICWMLAMFITVMLAILAVATLLLAIYFPADDPARDPLRAMHVVTFNGCWIAGVICLGFIPIVYRMRRTPPPRNVTIATIVIGIIPIVVYAATQIWHLVR